MSYEEPRLRSLDYELCHYGASRVACRGPARILEGPFALCLGGTETFGTYVARPYTALVEAELGLPVANLGVRHASVDVFLAEPDLMAAANRAKCVVVQITGAALLRNRYYAVHPRRNDRFLRPTEQLRALYPDLDFTDVNFVGHLLNALQGASPDVFPHVVEELRRTWVRRMTFLLNQINVPCVLLWMGDAAPGEDAKCQTFVDREMIAEVAPLADRYVEVVSSREARAAGTKGMTYGVLEAPAAAALPGPRLHEEVADALAPVLQDILVTQAQRVGAGASPSACTLDQSLPIISGTASKRSATRP